MMWQLTRLVTGLYGRNTWQHDILTGGVRRVDVAHTWANHRPTRGMLSLVGKGATWPNPGLPRGTPLLVRGCNVKFLLWVRRGSNAGPPGRQRTGAFGLATAPAGRTCYVNGRYFIYVAWELSYGGKRAGA
jgi:hypothetical protein